MGAVVSSPQKGRLGSRLTRSATYGWTTSKPTLLPSTPRPSFPDRGLQPPGSPSPTPICLPMRALTALPSTLPVTYGSRGHLVPAPMPCASIQGQSSPSRDRPHRVPPFPLATSSGILPSDSSGSLWVPEFSGCGRVTKAELKKSGSPPAHVTIGGSVLSTPQGLAFDSSGDLWVLNNGDQALVEFTKAELAKSGSPTPGAHHQRHSHGPEEPELPRHRDLGAKGTNRLRCLS